MATAADIVPSVRTPALVRRNTLLLAIASCVGWIAAQTIATLGGIIATQMTSERRWVGIPITVFILAGALTAPYAGRLMDQRGRKPVLIGGQLALAAGGLVAFAGVFAGSLWFFLGGVILLGMGAGIAALSRSAAADMYPIRLRARGISWVIMGGAVGAILGPQLLNLISASSRGTTDPLAVSWLVISPAAILALIALVMVHPEPRAIAADLPSYYPGEEMPVGREPSSQGTLEARPLSAILRQYPVVVAISATGLVQAGMVMLMATAALTLKEHGHGADVFAVMTSHYLGMLGLAVFIGRFADRLGRRLVIIAGALTFIAGAVTAPIFENPLYNEASLFLVGLGWSLCYVAGNAVLSDVTQAVERGRTLGANDLVTGVIGAVASLLAGIVLSGAGFVAVGALGLGLGLVPLLLALRMKEPRPGHYEGDPGPETLQVVPVPLDEA